MSCIHYKFKSSLDYEKLTFSGLHISLAELREAIMNQKKIGQSNEFKLEVVDAQSKKEYEKDDEMISRNSSVIVRRVPIPNAPKLPKTQHKDPSLLPQASSTDSHGKLAADELRKVGDLSSVDASEEDKLMAMMSQAGEGFDPSQYAKTQRYSGGGHGASFRNPPPPSYVCHRCGQKGHWIKMCPTNGMPSYDRLPFKRSMGIPSSQVSLANPDMPGAMMNRFGNFVVRTVDYNAMKSGKLKGGAVEAPAEVAVPPELTCSLCKELFKDAVKIPCCGKSFCDDCIRGQLLEKDFTCPACEQEDVSPDILTPNEDLRKAAKDFRSKVAEQKSFAVARGFVGGVPPQVTRPGDFTRQAQQVSAAPVTAAAAPPLRSSRISLVKSTSLATSTSQSLISSKPTAIPALSLTSTAPLISSTLPRPAAVSTYKTVSTSATATSTTNIVSSKPTEGTSTSTSMVNGAVTSVNKLDHSVEESAPPPATQANSSFLTVPRDTAAKSTARSRSPSPTRSRSVSPCPKTKVTTTDASLVKVQGQTPFSTAPVLRPVLPPTIPPTLLGSVLPPHALLINPLASIGPPPLPGMVPVLPTPPVIPLASKSVPPPPSQPISSSSTKLDRIAADLLSSASVKPPRTTSPPPLTAEEFYRQQKMLKHLIHGPTQRQSVSSQSSSYSDSSRSSRSSSPSSTSHSTSRSRSYTRSRSRSPDYRHRSSRKKAKHERREYYERDSERERSRHATRKRRHHEDDDALDDNDYHLKSKRRHHGKSSKKRKVSEDSLASVELTNSTGTSENEHRSRRHRHKKKKRHHRGEDGRRGSKVLLEEVADRAPTPSTTEKEEEAEEEKDLQDDQHPEKDVASASVEVPETHGLSDDQGVSSEPESMEASLVPYQDSSTTDVEFPQNHEHEEEEEESAKEKSLSVSPTMEEEDLEDEITLHVDDSLLDEEHSEVVVTKRTPTPSLSVNTTQTKEEGEISDSDDDTRGKTNRDTRGKTNRVLEGKEVEKLPIEMRLGEKVEQIEDVNIEEEEEEEEEECELQEEDTEVVKSDAEPVVKERSVVSAVHVLPSKPEPLSSPCSEESESTDVKLKEKRKRKHKSRDKHESKHKKARKHDSDSRHEMSRKHKSSSKHETSRKHESKSSSAKHESKSSSAKHESKSSSAKHESKSSSAKHESRKHKSDSSRKHESKKKKHKHSKTSHGERHVHRH